MSISVLAALGGGLLHPSTPVAKADDAGLTRGDGCFEGCRIRRLTPAGTWEVDSLDRHLARLGRSASALGIPYDQDAWRGLVTTVAEAWLVSRPEEDETSLRLILTRGAPGEGPTAYAYATSLPAGTAEARRDGIDVVTLTRGTLADGFADAPWLLGGVKTISYVVNMAAQREAERRGADDVIFLTADGFLLEAPTSSVVWTNARTVHTVADGPNGILHSITTELLFEGAAAEGWDVVAGAGTVDDLHAADVVLLVSSTRGPVLVRSIDGKPLTSTGAGLDALAAFRRITLFDGPPSRP